MSKLLIIVREPVGALMAGPAIRAWELASALSRHADVTLAVPEKPDISPDGFRAVVYRRDNPSSLDGPCAEADTMLISGDLLNNFPTLDSSGRPLIVDLYDPFPVENLNLLGHLSLDERMTRIASDFQVVGKMLRAGDFFICGSERQRDFWLGMLASAGRINPRTHGADPTLRTLIDVVSMGLPDQPPDQTTESAGHGIAGIGRDDFLVIWPGGLWDWLDPLTAVEAVHLIRDQAPDVKLLFPGLRHPHPEGVGSMENPTRVVQRSIELGLMGYRVFCRDWTPYAERSGYLRDADLALSLHRDDLEARLAIRARLLDCIWSETPVVSTQGDILAEAMADHGVATLVPPSDPAAVADAILAWRAGRPDRPRLAAGFRALANAHRWSVVCRPLVNYLRATGFAADHRPLITTLRSAGPPRTSDLPPPPVERWRTDNTLSLPFDQYQRHRQAAEIIEALREAPDRPVRLLDVGGGPGVTRRFLGPGDTVVSLDLHPQPGLMSLAGDATHLPFADNAFDYVTTLDTIEHLPMDCRPRMIDECLRVARRGFILIAPVHSAEAVAAESLLVEFIRRVLHSEHEQLREHLQNGLPDRMALESQLRATGYPFVVKPSGYIQTWLAMMLLKHQVMTLAGTDSLHRQIDSYHNLFHFESDQRAPSYRLAFFVAKTGGDLAVNTVSKVLTHAATTSLDESRELSPLGFLVDASALGSLSGERFRALTASLAEARQAIHEYEVELDSAHNLLDRVARGRVMRLMNALHAMTRRRTS